MNSPFPGMDPYLEEPSRWGGVHSRFINSTSDYLAERVSPSFLVDIEERVYILTPDEPERRPIVPDIYVVEGPNPQSATLVSEAISAPTLIEAVWPEEVRDRYIEIRDSANREVVTTIEILSPFNKDSGTPGREAFLRKRKTVMASKTHWIEIDLLRAGERPGELAAKSDYYSLLKRGGSHGPHEVWFFDLRDRLPTIAVPLRPPFEDVPLNLQTVFDTVYQRGHYADALDYSTPPPLPRLRPADSNWARERIGDWLAAREKETAR